MIVIEARISRLLTCLICALCRIAISILATPFNRQMAQAILAKRQPSTAAGSRGAVTLQIWESLFPQMGKSGDDFANDETVNEAIKLLSSMVTSGTAIDKRTRSRKAQRYAACATSWLMAHKRVDF